MEPWQILLLLGIVVLLYAYVFLKKDSSQSASPDFTAQMEETFETFAYEMEEENKQIMKHILQLKQEYEEKTRQLTERIESLERANPEPVPEEHTIRSRYHELWAYHKAGKSMEWITKKTGLPKGEVQLILKLAEQEESSHA